MAAAALAAVVVVVLMVVVVVLLLPLGELGHLGGLAVRLASEHAILAHNKPKLPRGVHKMAERRRPRLRAAAGAFRA